MQIKLVLKNDARSSSETTHFFDELLITIGSDPAANVFLDDARAAPEQAVIVNENEEPVFINQAKGTIYNGLEIERGARREVASGDRIKIGNFGLTVHFDSDDTFQAQESVKQNSIVSENAANGAASFDAEETSSEKTDIRSFADILSSLRKEEDQFYFQIVSENGQQRERVSINSQEIFLGWNAEKGVFTADREIITEPQAVVRKDWSGVTIYPQGKEEILINNSLLEAGQRLKNGDQLVFTRKSSYATSEEVTLIFCEPAALVELNSILPQELLTTAIETGLTPEAQRKNQPGIDEIGARNGDPAYSGAETQAKTNPRYFGYFTGVEILIMIFATILTAALTFLLLEFS